VSVISVVISSFLTYFKQEIILMGWVLWAIGLGLLATLTRESTLAQQIGYSLLTGLGVGLTLQA